VPQNDSEKERTKE